MSVWSLIFGIGRSSMATLRGPLKTTAFMVSFAMVWADFPSEYQAGGCSIGLMRLLVLASEYRLWEDQDIDRRPSCRGSHGRTFPLGRILPACTTPHYIISSGLGGDGLDVLSIQIIKDREMYWIRELFVNAWSTSQNPTYCPLNSKLLLRQYT